MRSEEVGSSLAVKQERKEEMQEEEEEAGEEKKERKEMQMGEYLKEEPG